MEVAGTAARSPLLEEFDSSCREEDNGSNEEQAFELSYSKESSRSPDASHQLTPDDRFIRNLIDAIRQHPCLYNPNHEHYGNRQASTQFRADAWLRISKELNYKGEASLLQTYWKRLRERYVRERRKRRQAGLHDPIENGPAASATLRHYAAMKWIDEYSENRADYTRQRTNTSGNHLPPSQLITCRDTMSANASTSTFSQSSSEAGNIINFTGPGRYIQLALRQKTPTATPHHVIENWAVGSPVQAGTRKRGASSRDKFLLPSPPKFQPQAIMPISAREDAPPILIVEEASQNVLPLGSKFYQNHLSTQANVESLQSQQLQRNMGVSELRPRLAPRAGIIASQAFPSSNQVITRPFMNPVLPQRYLVNSQNIVSSRQQLVSDPDTLLVEAMVKHLSELNDDEKVVTKMNIQKILMDARFGSGACYRMLQEEDTQVDGQLFQQQMGSEPPLLHRQISPITR